MPDAATFLGVAAWAAEQPPDRALITRTVCERHAIIILSLVKPVSDTEVAAVLGAAIRDGKSGTMTRGAEVFLATVCAESLVDGMAQAGLVVVMRRAKA